MLAKGLRKLAIILRIDKPFILILAKSQIIKPAGIATWIALSKTNSVLSIIDRIMIFP